MKNINVWLFFHWQTLFILGLGIIAGGVMFSLPPISQDLLYHDFADQRRIWGIPNLLNVASNIPFAIVSFLGLLFLQRKTANQFPKWEKYNWQVLFAGIGLTAVGSAHYHLDPNNTSLFWDRLPMAVVFMSLFSIVIADCINSTAGRWLFLPLLTIGIGGVVYWHLTDDLRPYILIQFFPMIAVPLLIFILPGKYTRTTDWLIIIGWYVLAKICEVLDLQILAIGNQASGHTLKHLFSGTAVFWLLRMVKNQKDG